MKYVLILIYYYGSAFSQDSQTFADYKSCMEAGKNIQTWVKSESSRKLDYTCIKITGQ